MSFEKFTLLEAVTRETQIGHGSSYVDSFFEVEALWILLDSDPEVPLFRDVPPEYDI